ncbi:amidohydrolase family protein [Ottowia thiooxydans]|uniref:TIM-barrel fold metal-dependent hydrolase n=1 Tax=Ottowia thiooxydans TaxID=219182 RepID=A0ABV2Q964_9BURK
MASPDITGGIPAIDHHSHASMARFRTVDQIDRQFATAHLEANVSAQTYAAFITARNAADTATLELLEQQHGTETLMRQGLEFRSTTFFARALREGTRRLYGPDKTWDAIEATAQDWGTRHPTYSYEQASRVANTPVILTDVPRIDHTVWDRQRYRQIMRIDPYVYAFHPGQTEELRGTEFQRFHGGFANVLRQELQHDGMTEPPARFDDYIQFMDASLERRVRAGVVGLKIASAYVRPINFEPASAEAARTAYEGLAAGRAVDRQPFEDFVIQRAAQYAADHGLPMQIHVGMGHPEPGMRISNSAPFLLETFLNIKSLNRLRVTLLHGGYPFSSHVAALVQTYGNVFLDFSWMPYLHHAYLRLKLSEWMEILPANKLLFGSDAGAPEFHVAAAHYARQALNDVLHDGCERGVWDARQADWLAKRILWENSAELYGIDPKDVTGTPAGQERAAALAH